MCAYLEIIIGCMFAGKSTEMIRRLKRHKAIGEKVLVINSSKDTRNPASVLQTHDRETFTCVKMDKLVKTEQYKTATVIAIDEAQFFTDLRSFVEEALRDNKHVIVSGLDGDFQQQMFGEILYLIPLADEVTKLKALCMKCKDGKLAPFTKRTTSDLAQELIGDCNVYTACCRKHLG